MKKTHRNFSHYKTRTSTVLETVLEHIGVSVRKNTITGLPDCNFGQGWQPLSDADEAVIRDKINIASGESDAFFTKRQWDDALTALIERTPHNPLQAFLDQYDEAALELSYDEALQVFVDWGKEVLNMPTEMQTVSYGAALLWVGVIQRGLNPGCYQRVIPVLVGGQNIGKSTALREMLPADMYRYFQPRLNLFADDYTFYYGMEGMLLCEVSELVGAAKNDAELFKSRIGEGWDKYRRKYAKRITDNPRTTFIAATTNGDTPLPKDLTGNTRFLMLPCNVSQDDLLDPERKNIMETMAEWRDKCWAAALRLYLEGFSAASLPPELEAEQRIVNEQYTPSDETMEGRVERYLEDGGWTGGLRLYEIAESAGVIPVGGDFSSRGKQTELKKILRRLGAEELRIKQTDGTSPRLWTLS